MNNNQVVAIAEDLYILYFLGDPVLDLLHSIHNSPLHHSSVPIDINCVETFTVV